MGQSKTNGIYMYFKTKTTKQHNGRKGMIFFLIYSYLPSPPPPNKITLFKYFLWQMLINPIP